MNWEAVGAIGSVAAAIAVVATLFYMSQQIRQNSEAINRTNEYARAASLAQNNAMYVQVFSQISNDAELAAIYHRALAGEDIDDHQARRFAAFVNTFFAVLENLHAQASAELASAELTAESPDGVISFSFPYWGRLLATTQGRKWWRNEAPYLYPPDFVSAVNNVMTANEKSDESGPDS